MRFFWMLPILVWLGCSGKSTGGCVDNPGMCTVGLVCDPIANQCVGSQGSDMAMADMTIKGVWVGQPSGTTNNLYGVWASSATDAWAVGQNGSILRWNGSAWSAAQSPTGNDLRGVFGVDSNNVWAVGGSGTILKWNGTSWSSQTSGTASTLRGVWALNATNVWAVGDQIILNSTGGSWTSQSLAGVGTGTAQPSFQAVWGSAASDVYAVGMIVSGAVIARNNGSGWAGNYGQGFSNGCFGVWGTDANNLWAAGAQGQIVRGAFGVGFSAPPSGTLRDLNGIWASNVSNAWAVGAAGTIQYFNGAMWSGQPSGTSVVLQGVSGFAGTDVWAVGESGTILHLQR